MPDSISSLSDSAIIDVGTQAHDAANANLADYLGVTQQMVDDVKNAYTAFSPQLGLHVQRQAEAKSQTQTKDAARKPLEAALRTLRNVAKAAGTSAAALAALGIPSGASSHAPTTATRPIGSVDTSQRLQHTIKFADSATPDNKRRPRGAMGCEIWSKIDGPPPTDESDCIFVSLDATPPHVVHYGGEFGGKTAHYLLRWRMNDGSVGPWSETITATITA